MVRRTINLAFYLRDDGMIADFKDVARRIDPRTDDIAAHVKPTHTAGAGCYRCSRDGLLSRQLGLDFYAQFATLNVVTETSIDAE